MVLGRGGRQVSVAHEGCLQRKELLSAPLRGAVKEGRGLGHWGPVIASQGIIVKETEDLTEEGWRVGDRMFHW